MRTYYSQLLMTYLMADYKASNTSMVSKNELERCGMKQSWSNHMYYCSICPQGMRKTMANLRLPGLWADIWDSLVGIETLFGLDGLGIESWWGRDFSHRSRVALGHSINHSPTSTVKVKERVELHAFFPLCDCMASYRENFIPFTSETWGAAHSRTKSVSTGVLISPQPDLLPDVFCLMVRIFHLKLVLLYI